MTPEERRQLETLQDQIYQRGFTDDQMAQVLENQRDILQRDRDLQNVLTSIVELQDMFKEFQSLVIEQGTLLDRIDTNIDKAEFHVQEGVEYVKGAEKIQGYNKVTICLLFVVVAVIAISVIVGIKITVKISGIA